MNHQSRFNTNPAKSPESLRSDIDGTRQRLDDTIDAIASRLRGRHLVDEMLHLARQSKGSGEVRRKADEIRDKVTDATGTAVQTVVETVKAHPWPALLVGAGLAWMAYDKKRQASAPPTGPNYDPDYDARREAGYGASAMEESEAAGQMSPPEDYSEDVSAKMEGGGESKLQEMKEAAGEKAAEVKQRLQRGAARVGERAREGSQRLRERSRELGGRIQERAGIAYEQTRERVSETVEEHPLESAIACLAAGVLVGMILPTPRAIDDVAGPTSDRVRRRVRESAREVVEKGKHVARAAVSAAREEARSQGLTPEALRESAEAVAERARAAATDTARKEAGAAAPPASPTPSPSGRLPDPESASAGDAASPGF